MDFSKEIEFVKQEDDPMKKVFITEGLAINGDNAATCDKDVENWIRSIGLK